jgi:hypothetical protein
MMLIRSLWPFVRAKAGTQSHSLKFFDLSHWVPAFAGTNGGMQCLNLTGERFKGGDAR